MAQRPPLGSTPGNVQPDRARTVNAGAGPDANAQGQGIRQRLLQAAGIERNPNGVKSPRRIAIEEAVSRIPDELLPQAQKDEVSTLMDVYATGDPNRAGFKELIMSYGQAPLGVIAGVSYALAGATDWSPIAKAGLIALGTAALTGAAKLGRGEMDQAAHLKEETGLASRLFGAITAIANNVDHAASLRQARGENKDMAIYFALRNAVGTDIEVLQRTVDSMSNMEPVLMFMLVANTQMAKSRFPLFSGGAAQQAQLDQIRDQGVAALTRIRKDLEALLAERRAQEAAMKGQTTRELLGLPDPSQANGAKNPQTP